MQQQDEGTDVPQENAQPEIQEPASDEINDETSTLVVQDVNGSNDSVSKTAFIENKLQTEPVEKSNTEDISDLPPVRSKTSKHPSKRAHKQKRDDVEIHENIPVTEIQNGEGLNEGELIQDDTVLANVAEAVEGNAPEVTFPVPEDSNGILDSSEEFEHPTYVDNEEEKSESLQEIVEEKISVAASVLYKESTPLVDVPQGETEKYSLSISSSEVQQYKVAEEGFQNEFNPHSLYVRGSTLGGNIRSISARRPVRKHSPSISERSVSSGRHGNLHMSVDNHSDTECSVVTTEGSIFSKLKRKAFDIDNLGSKKRKVNETKNSIFLSMVSSPLRLFSSKLNEGIIEGHSVENISEDKKEDCDEIINDKLKEGYGTKETSQYVLAGEVSNQNTLYRSWCSIM